MKLAKDSLWLLFARIGSLGMSASLTVLLARRLGSAGFGEYAVITAVVLIGNMLTTFGTDMTLVREIAAENDLSSLPSALTIQLVLSLLFITGTWFFAPLLLSNADAVHGLQLYVTALIPLALFTVFSSILRGKQFADAYAWLNLAGAALKLICVWFFVGEQTNIFTLSFLLLGTQLFTTFLGVVICHLKIKDFWRHWKLQNKDVLQLLKVSSPLAGLTVLMLLQQKLPTLILSILGGPAATGIFSAAGRTVEAAETGHSAVFTAIYPEMARETESVRVKNSFIFLFLAAILGAMILSVWATPVTQILFGRGYEASACALRILAWMMIPYTVNTFLTLKFVALKNETPVLYSLLLSLFILVLCSVVWIPRNVGIGAASSALTAEMVQAVFLFLQWRVGWVFRTIPISKT